MRTLMFSPARLASWLAAVTFLVPTLHGALPAYQRINRQNGADLMAVEIYRLTNGLTVYLSENPTSPRFHSEIAVRAGSKHDPAESTGLAHYLEHLLFKGTQKMGTTDYSGEKVHIERIADLYEKHFHETDPARRREIYSEINRESQLAAAFAIPNEMDKLYKSMGETGLNAHTSDEETVYTVGLPANRLAQWAVIESERFRNPVFRLFQPELEIVYEEKNRTLDSKERVILYAVNKQLYKRHPYGQQTTIGEVEHLKNPSLKNVQRFFETYYVPNNMAIAISGDIDSQQAIKLISQHFSTWKAKPLPELKKWEEPPLQGVERVTVKYRGEEYVMLAFRTVPRGHPDEEALKLVDMILDNAAAGLINLNLNQQQKVRRAGSQPDFNNDYGSQVLWGIPKKGQSLQEVENLLIAQLELIKQGKFEDWLIPAIITDYKKNLKAGFESDEFRAARMRNAFIAFEDWDHVVGEIARIEKVTKADVVRVANRYFGRDYVAGYRVDQQQDVPKIEKPQLDKIQIDASRQSDFYREVMMMPVKEIQPSFVKAGVDYQKTSLARGVTLYYARNPLNDLFTLSLSVDLGTRHDNRLGLATQFLDKSGTRRLAPDDLKKEWFKLGTDFSVHAADQETTIQLAGLDENFERSLQLLHEVLTTPAADPAILEELKSIVFVQREDAKKDYRVLASAVTQYNRYGKDSMYLRALPNESIRKLTAEDLHGLIRGLLQYEHTINYVGALPLPKVQETLRRVLAPAKNLKPPPPYLHLKVTEPSTNRIFLFHKEIAQSQVHLDFGDGVVDEASQPAVQLYNDYFSGGMAGLLFQELRESRALAYSVYAVYANGARKADQNVMVGGIACQPDKTAEALEAFVTLLDDLPLSGERFADSKASLLNRYRTSKLTFREVLDAVQSWEHLGLSGDPREGRFKQIRKASMDLVIQFQKKHLKDRHKLISIVGNKDKMDLPRLEKNADITELKLEELFAY